ncbi:MAG: hypothetical protein U0414_22425 [Polyangiaceae bacterium]
MEQKNNDIELANRVLERFAARYPRMSAQDRYRACHEILAHESFAIDPIGRLRVANGSALARLGYDLMAQDRPEDIRDDVARLARALAGDDYAPTPQRTVEWWEKDL